MSRNLPGIFTILAFPARRAFYLSHSTFAHLLHHLQINVAPTPIPEATTI